jgi:hypothetical protein
VRGMTYEKDNCDIKGILQKIKENASKTYFITAIVEKYMSCVEEVINIATLISRFKETVK